MWTKPTRVGSSGQFDFGATSINQVLGSWIVRRTAAFTQPQHAQHAQYAQYAQYAQHAQHAQHAQYAVDEADVPPADFHPLAKNN